MDLSLSSLLSSSWQCIARNKAVNLTCPASRACFMVVDVPTRTEPREGSRDNVRKNVESRRMGDRRNRISRSFCVVKSANVSATVGRGQVERNETRKFMQYTKASNSIYNRDKHVFPIRTPSSPVAPTRK